MRGTTPDDIGRDLHQEKEEKARAGLARLEERALSETNLQEQIRAAVHQFGEEWKTPLVQLYRGLINARYAGDDTFGRTLPPLVFGLLGELSAEIRRKEKQQRPPTWAGEFKREGILRVDVDPRLIEKWTERFQEQANFQVLGVEAAIALTSAKISGGGGGRRVFRSLALTEWMIKETEGECPPSLDERILDRTNLTNPIGKSRGRQFVIRRDLEELKAQFQAQPLEEGEHRIYFADERDALPPPSGEVKGVSLLHRQKFDEQGSELLRSHLAQDPSLGFFRAAVGQAAGSEPADLRAWAPLGGNKQSALQWNVKAATIRLVNQYPQLREGIAGLALWDLGSGPQLFRTGLDLRRLSPDAIRALWKIDAQDQATSPYREGGQSQHHKRY